MTESARELLAAFDALDPSNGNRLRWRFSVAQRRLTHSQMAALEGMAEELFLSYDAEERPGFDCERA